MQIQWSQPVDGDQETDGFLCLPDLCFLALTLWACFLQISCAACSWSLYRLVPQSVQFGQAPWWYQKRRLVRLQTIAISSFVYLKADFDQQDRVK